MDSTPILHALIAVSTQGAVGLLTGNWWLGGALACTWWVAREHTQAEYRWIEKYGQGKRANMPKLAGFYLNVWNIPSILDALIPSLAVAFVYLFAA